jgi:uncharacterized membrane protein
MELLEDVASYASGALEITGIASILGGALIAVLTGAVLLYRQADGRRTYRLCRGRLGRGILIGLEFLVAADIIKTIAVRPSFTSVGVLAIVVLIRTFLSLTLEVEMNGRWPWQGPPES